MTAQARSRALVPRNTASQPSRAATTGPTKTASDWPIVPRPYTPRAVPWRAAGVQRETKAAPTENDDPAMPIEERRDEQRAVAAGQRDDKGGQRREDEERGEHERVRRIDPSGCPSAAAPTSRAARGPRRTAPSETRSGGRGRRTPMRARRRGPRRRTTTANEIVARTSARVGEESSLVACPTDGRRS